MPAAAKYNATGEPSPPVPIMRADEFLSLRCPPTLLRESINGVSNAGFHHVKVQEVTYRPPDKRRLLRRDPSTALDEHSLRSGCSPRNDIPPAMDGINMIFSPSLIGVATPCRSLILF